MLNFFSRALYFEGPVNIRYFRIAKFSWRFLMLNIGRISAKDAYERVENNRALLICAYDRDDKFERFQLEGAISLSEFESGLNNVAKDKELIFY